MFDMGFLEMLLIGVIALLVFGPEKLPAAARTAGLWVGRIRHILGKYRDEIDRELRLSELQEQMNQTQQTVQDTMQKTQQTLNQSILEEEKSAAVDEESTAKSETIEATKPKPALDSPAPQETRPVEENKTDKQTS